jgi:PAS domain-containing protein
VRLLANPIILRMGLGLLLSLAAFAAGIFGIRALRRKLVEGEPLPDPLGGSDDASYAYSAVIQKLKQQKFELQNEQAAQKRRAKTSEQITAAVIANLPCGILLIGPNGLVRQANAATRQLLGFASPLGMGPDDLFRDTVAVPEAGEPVSLADAVRSCLRERVRANFQSNYETSLGEQRSLALTLIPLTMDEACGLACVIADETAVAQLKRDGLLRSEVSAEMALQLRTSLSVIRECASQISGADRQDVARLANEIAAETDRLDKAVGGFLAGSAATKAAAAGA